MILHKLRIRDQKMNLFRYIFKNYVPFTIAIFFSIEVIGYPLVFFNRVKITEQQEPGVDNFADIEVAVTEKNAGTKKLWEKSLNIPGRLAKKQTARFEIPDSINKVNIFAIYSGAKLDPFELSKDKISTLRGIAFYGFASLIYSYAKKIGASVVKQPSATFVCKDKTFQEIPLNFNIENL